jgi:hypothetical protein
MPDVDLECARRLLEDTEFRPPTRLERAIALPLSWLFNLLARLIPARWLIEEPSIAPRTLGGKFAVWAYSGAYFYDERRAGRI